MASKRIQKELKDLQKDPPTSCSAGPTAFFLAYSSVDFFHFEPYPRVGVRFCAHASEQASYSQLHMLASFSIY